MALARTRLLGGIAIVAAAAAISAAPARAAGPAWVGTTGFDDPSPEDFALMAEAVGTYRSNLYWPAVELLIPGTRDWSRYDAVFEGAAAARIRVLPTIYGSPRWAAARPERPPDPSHLDEFRRFARAAAERYGREGAFWSEHPELPALPVRTWQIWNEPNHAAFWGDPDAAEYAALLEAAAAGIRSGDPSAEILTGGLFPAAIGGEGVPMEAYLPELYAAGAAADFDAVAVHPYAAEPERAFEIIEEARAIMDAHGDAAKPIWVTEIGWATSGDPSGVTVEEGTQAEYLRRSFERAAAERERLGLAGVVWFSFKDEPGTAWPDRTGLLRMDGSRKPSWDAIEALGAAVPLAGLIAAARALGGGVAAAAGAIRER